MLQETRAFNDTPVNPRKCIQILTKILYLINQGEQLGTREATDCFFAMTKLFQSKDVVLRRMVYLGIKDLSSIAEDVIIVTSSLTKDMTGKEDLYRAAAIRALCSITDNTMLQAVERYMKQCIVDKNAAVSCAALVSSLRLATTAGDVVKRWANEAQEALNSENIMVQYHALGLLYHIRKSDRLAVTKLVNKLTRNSMKSPYAVCMLVILMCIYTYTFICILFTFLKFIFRFELLANSLKRRIFLLMICLNLQCLHLSNHACGTKVKWSFMKLLML